MRSQFINQNKIHKTNKYTVDNINKTKKENYNKNVNHKTHSICIFHFENHIHISNGIENPPVLLSIKKLKTQHCSEKKNWSIENGL